MIVHHYFTPLLLEIKYALRWKKYVIVIHQVIVPDELVAKTSSSNVFREVIRANRIDVYNLRIHMRCFIKYSDLLCDFVFQRIVFLADGFAIWSNKPGEYLLHEQCCTVVEGHTRAERCP